MTASAGDGPGASRAARWAARAAALLVAAIGVASCTAVLSLDGFDSASGKLCDVLDSCYPAGKLAACGDRIDGALGGDTGAADDWLSTIASRGCFDSCSSARRCLDFQPVCARNVGDACDEREECCDFSAGTRDCNLEKHVCCVTTGSRCTDDTDCCPGAGVCNKNANPPTCGGTLCRATAERCDLDEQCCSGVCKAHVCADQICNDDGFDCKEDHDCCSKHCEAGRCTQAMCGLLNAPCEADQDCCQPDTPTTGTGGAVVCFMPLGASTGICSTGSCVADEGDCATDDQCCGGLCDKAYHKCRSQCSAGGTPCAADADCCSSSCQGGMCADTCSNTDCTTSDDCCSKNCRTDIGTCVPTCNPSMCHSACAVGPPLDATCTTDGACAAKMCDYDPYCCCSGWDSFCVVEAVKVCSLTCP